MIQVETFEKEYLSDLKFEVNNFCKKYNVINVCFTTSQSYSSFYHGNGSIAGSKYAAMIVYETER